MSSEAEQDQIQAAKEGLENRSRDPFVPPGPPREQRLKAAIATEELLEKAVALSGEKKPRPFARVVVIKEQFPVKRGHKGRVMRSHFSPETMPDGTTYQRLMVWVRLDAHNGQIWLWAENLGYIPDHADQ
jgi:hypothetical protein